MPGLPGSNPKKDLKLFKELFSNQNYKPDQLKIYPLQIMEGTPLSLQFKRGEFKIYDKEIMVDLLCKMKSEVPEYCRIMRVLRQFHPDTITAGKINTNIRVDIKEEMKKKGLKCRCIRCREIGLAKKTALEKPKLNVMEYKASDGKEFFLSFESDDYLLGICRARIPSKPFRKEITKDTLIIRELHVYGKQVIIDEDSKHTQHKGLGKKLMKKAEEIAKKNECNKIVIISGIGVKEYYKKLGYKKDGQYVSKKT
jgi:elongator complex protein 3